MNKKANLNHDYISIGKASQMLEMSTNTIKRWYKWWESEEFEKPSDLILPPYYYKDKRMTKFFKMSDLPVLDDFRNKLQSTHRGAMSDFNAADQWGKRGDKILQNRGIIKKDVLGKIR